MVTRLDRQNRGRTANHWGSNPDIPAIIRARANEMFYSSSLFKPILFEQPTIQFIAKVLNSHSSHKLLLVSLLAVRIVKLSSLLLAKDVRAKWTCYQPGVMTWQQRQKQIGLLPTITTQTRIPWSSGTLNSHNTRLQYIDKGCHKRIFLLCFSIIPFVSFPFQNRNITTLSQTIQS